MGQRALTVQINVMRPYPANLNYYIEQAENINLTFTNHIPQAQEFYFDMKLHRNGQLFAAAHDPQIFAELDIPLSVQGHDSKMVTGIDIGDRFAGINLDDFFIAEGELLTGYLVGAIVLPEGEYDLLVTAYDFNTHEPLSEPGVGSFEIEHGDPPIINNMEDGGCVLMQPDGGFLVHWQSASVPMMSDPTVELTYRLEIYELLDGNAENSLFQPPVLRVDDLEQQFYNVNIEGDQELQYDASKEYVAAITVYDPLNVIAFKNGGQSTLIQFRFCDQLAVETIYPSDGISVPFRPVPIIVDFDPAQPTIQVLNAHIYGYDIVEQEYVWDPDVHTVMPGSSFEVFSLADESTSNRVFQALRRGNQYSWHTDVLLERDLQSGSESLIQGVSDNATFISGMPPVHLDYPENGYHSGTHQVTFGWENSDLFTNYFPPTEVIHGEGEADQFLATVHEKMVFQLATSENFELNSIVAQENYLFKFDSINLFATDNADLFADAALEGTTLPDDDVNSIISDQLFGSFSHTEQLSPGNYFWRVFYLRDPTLPVNLPRTFIQEEYYHMSEVRSLTIGENLESDCLSGCLFVNETKLSTLQLFEDQPLDTIYAGHFSITELDITSRNDERVSGTGVVVMPDFLLNIPIGVRFSNVRINFFKHLVEGEIVSVIEDNLLEFDLEGLDAGALADHDFLRDFNELISTGRLISTLAGGEAIGLPLGVDFDIQGYQAIVGLTRLVLGRDRADAHFFLTVPLPFDGYTRYLPFGGSICISPNGYEDAGLIHLREEVMALQFGESGTNDSWSMAFSGLDGSAQDIRQQASFLEFDCHGAKTFALRGGVRFPRSWLVPDDIEGSSLSGQVEGRFDVMLDRNNDPLGRPAEGLQFIAGVDFDPFQLAALPDIGFALDEVYLDFSDVENAPGFAYPEGYESLMSDPEMIDTWRGVFVRTAEIRFPAGFFGLAARQSTGFNRLLIDETGVTFNAFVSNFGEASSPGGSLGGFSLSLDTVQLRVVQNDIEAFELKGDIGVPLLRREDRLRYSAGLSLAKLEEDTLQYIFDVRPRDNVQMPFLMAQAHLSEATRLNVTYNQSLSENNNEGNIADAFVFDLMLAGELTISDQFNANNDIELPSTITLPRLPFELGFHSQRGFLNNSRIDLGSFTSPGATGGANTSSSNDQQKELGGFPVQLTAFDFGVRETDLTLTIGAQVMLMDNSLGVGASVILIGGLTETGDFGLESVEFGCLNIAADVMGFGINGEFCYFNNRDANGLGSAGISGTSNVLGMVDLEVAFGAHKSADDEFLFAYGLGQFLLPPPGIPLGQSGISMFGFGLGFGWNTALPAVAPAYDDSAHDPPAAGVYSLKYQPVNDRIWAKANVLLGGALPESFHTDVALALEFQTGPTFGLRSAQLLGSGYVMTPLDQHDHSPVRFTLDSEIRFPRLYDQVEFVVNSDVFVQMMPFDGARYVKGTMNPSNYLAGNIFFMLNNTSNQGDLQWYVHAGKYGWDASGTYDETLMGLGLSIPGMESLGEINLNAYAMLGMDIPTQIRPLPSLITEILSNSSSSIDGALSASDVSSERSGLPTGLGSGITFGGSLSANVDIDAVLLRANLETEIGFDVNLTHSENQQTCTGSEAGVNGWYGTGQAYAGIRGGMGIVVPEWLSWAADGNEVWTLFHLEAAIAVMVGGPNPFWLEGQGRVQYDVFGGLLQGEETFFLQLGDKCAVPQGNPAAEIDLISGAFPASNPDPFTGLDLDDVAIDIEPFVEFSLPINEVYAFTPIQSNGEAGSPVEMQVRVDSLYLVEFYPYSTQNNQILSAAIQTAGDQRRKTIKPVSALKPGQLYMLRAQARIYERKVGESWNATSAKDDLYVMFRTTSSIRLTDDMISYTYPPQDQKYFLTGEHLGAQGKIVLERDFSELLPPNFDFRVRIKNLDSEEEFLVPAKSPTSTSSQFVGRIGQTINSTDFTYEMPQLSQGQNYEVKLLAIERKEEVESTNSSEAVSSTSDNNQVVAANLASNLHNQISPFMSLPQNIFNYRFSTSMYATAAAKMDATDIAYQRNPSELEKAKGHLRIENPEGFDIYDIDGIPNAQGIRVIKPFFNFQDEFLSPGHQYITSRLTFPIKTLQNNVKSMDHFKVDLQYRYPVVTKAGKVGFRTMETLGDFDNSSPKNIRYDFKQGDSRVDGSFGISVPKYPGHTWYDFSENAPVPIALNAFQKKTNGELLLQYDVLQTAQGRFSKLKSWYYHLISVRAQHAIGTGRTLSSGPIFFEEFAQYPNVLPAMDQFFLDQDASLVGADNHEFQISIKYQIPGRSAQVFSKSYKINPVDHEDFK